MAFGKYTKEEILAKLKAKQVKAKTTPKRAKIKRSKVKPKKIKKVSVSKLHKDTWAECRRVASINLPKDCYTCPSKDLQGLNCQLGHGQSKGALPLEYKYDMRNLKWQCFHCNINLQGCQEIFLSKLEKEESGKEFLQESSYKDENGAWRVQKREPINARDFLTNTLNNLKLIK